MTIVASKLGAPEHPSWFHNARANPDVLLGGRPFRAEVVEDEAERARLWELADRVFPPYAAYRERAARAGRTIPILQLVARAERPRDAPGWRRSARPTSPRDRCRLWRATGRPAYAARSPVGQTVAAKPAMSVERGRL